MKLATGQQLGPPAMAGPRKGLREGKAADEKLANPSTWRPEVAQGPAEAAFQPPRQMPVRGFPAAGGDLED